MVDGYLLPSSFTFYCSSPGDDLSEEEAAQHPRAARVSLGRNSGIVDKFLNLSGTGFHPVFKGECEASMPMWAGCEYYYKYGPAFVVYSGWL